MDLTVQTCSTGHGDKKVFAKEKYVDDSRLDRELLQKDSWPELGVSGSNQDIKLPL